MQTDTYTYTNNFFSYDPSYNRGNKRLNRLFRAKSISKRISIQTEQYTKLDIK